MLLNEKVGSVTVLTLNRPEAMNALNKALRAALNEALEAAQADPEIGAIVLTAPASGAFTAGLDLKELGSEPGGIAAANSTEPSINPARAILACRKPIIAAVNGVAITGGFELAMSCDVIFAADTARFADTHVRVGISPTWGLSQRLSRIIGPYRAKELSLSGNFLDAATAERWGLVNRLFPQADLLPAAIKLAGEIAQCDPEFVAHMKGLIDGYALPFADGMALEQARSVPHNEKQTPEMMEARRLAVLERGRKQ